MIAKIKRMAILNDVIERVFLLYNILIERVFLLYNVLIERVFLLHSVLITTLFQIMECGIKHKSKVTKHPRILVQLEAYIKNITVGEIVWAKKYSSIFKSPK